MTCARYMTSHCPVVPHRLSGQSLWPVYPILIYPILHDVNNMKKKKTRYTGRYTRTCGDTAARPLFNLVFLYIHVTLLQMTQIHLKQPHTDDPNPNKKDGSQQPLRPRVP